MSKAKVIHKDGLFVRKDKSRSSEWVRIIPCGEEFEFYEEYKGWLKVVDGWVVCSDVYIKPTEVTAGGSGGASSWNDLTDKPFGENKAVVEWDGNTEGLTQDPMGFPMYKVSDLTPAYEEVLGGTHVFCDSDGEFETPITRENVHIINEHIYGSDPFFVVTEPTEFDDVDFDEPGIYFLKVDDTGAYVKSLTWSEVKTIDPKFLSNIENTVVTIEIDDNYNVVSASMSTEDIAKLIEAGHTVIAHVPSSGIYAPFNVLSMTTSRRPYVFCHTLSDSAKTATVGGYYSGSKSADVWEYRETELAIVEN